ncbi:MAG: hypothetical protein IPI42_08510 [Saprospiraceae bacterium]|nr:hypothetical protein [Candidatus Parvibacillus calidus]
MIHTLWVVPPTVYYSPATGIKTNSSGTNPARGNMYFFNNTFTLTTPRLHDGAPVGRMENIYFVNNIFRTISSILIISMD